MSNHDTKRYQTVNWNVIFNAKRVSYFVLTLKYNLLFATTENTFERFSQFGCSL